MKKIKYVLFSILILLVSINTAYADTITSYEVFGLTNEQFNLASGGTRTGTLAISVDDMSSIKPYINILYATTSYGDFTITSNSYFKGSYIEKKVSNTPLSGYNADLRILQIPTTGNNWNCSSSGTNCYISTTISVKNTTDYTGLYQVQSVALTDEVLTDDYLDNLIIDKNNQIIEQGQQTNEKLEDLNENINDTFNSCRESYNLLNPKYNRGFSWSSGQETSSNLSTITSDFIATSPGKSYSSNYSFYIFYYDASYTYLGNSSDLRTTGGVIYTSTAVPSNSSIKYLKLWFRPGAGINPDDMTIVDIMFNEGSSVKKYEAYGEEICQNKIDETNDKIDQTNQQLGDLNNNLTNSDSSDATNEAGNFFSGFETDTFGLTSIITAPLDLIGSITSSSCSPLPLKVPFVDKSFNLPCMSTIYEEYFGSFLTIYQTITFGIVAYWVCVRIFALVKDFKNPDHDEIEVLDL